MTRIVTLQRVFYEWGERRLPYEARRYFVENLDASPVGTIDELSEFLARAGIDKVTYRVRDADGVSWRPDLTLKHPRDPELEG